MGLTKMAGREIILRDTMGGNYKISSLPLQDRSRIKQIAMQKGPGYRGNFETVIDGSKKMLKVSVNDTETIVPKKTALNIAKNNSQPNMLYKETLKKSASFAGHIDARTYKGLSDITKKTKNTGLSSVKKATLRTRNKSKEAIIKADKETRFNKYKHLGPARAKFNAAVDRFIPNPIVL